MGGTFDGNDLTVSQLFNLRSAAAGDAVGKPVESRVIKCSETVKII